MSFLYPYTSLDTIGRYAKVAPLLYKFLGNRELAAKIIGPNFTLLKRGTILKPLSIEDLQEVDDQYLQRRSIHHLKDIKKLLTPKQTLIWQYFFPRKMVNFFYACNHEHGNQIDRVFIDIDRQDIPPQTAQKVAKEILEILYSHTPKTLKYKPFCMRTGSSFHVYLFLDTIVDHTFYDNYFSYGINKADSLITKRATEIRQKTNIPVFAGHERKKGTIILDTSNTPAGKLARCPFSLHIKNDQKYDGIAVPVSFKDLEDPVLIEKLQELSPEIIREKKEQYAKIINEALR